MIYAFIGMIVFTTVYFFLPGESRYVTIALANMVALGVFIYSANAVFFSIIDEVRIPAKVTGTAAGLISLLTYFPEIYCYDGGQYGRPQTGYCRLSGCFPVHVGLRIHRPYRRTGPPACES